MAGSGCHGGPVDTGGVPADRGEKLRNLGFERSNRKIGSQNAHHWGHIAELQKVLSAQHGIITALEARLSLMEVQLERLADSGAVAGRASTKSARYKRKLQSLLDKPSTWRESENSRKPEHSRLSTWSLWSRTQVQNAADKKDAMPTMKLEVESENEEHAFAVVDPDGDWQCSVQDFAVMDPDGYPAPSPAFLKHLMGQMLEQQSELQARMSQHHHPRSHLGSIVGGVSNRTMEKCHASPKVSAGTAAQQPESEVAEDDKEPSVVHVIKRSMWDVALILSFSGVQFSQKVIICIGIVLNVGMQMLLVLVVYFNMLDNSFAPEQVQRMLEWRALVGHSDNEMDKYNGKSFMENLCDLQMPMSYEQHMYQEITDYLFRDMPGWALSALAIVLWVLTITVEFRAAFEQTVVICCLPRLPPEEPEIVATEDGFRIRGISKVMRIMSLFVISIPRLSVLMALMSVGCKYLAYTLSLSDIVLNSLALAFVMHVDELLAWVLLSRRTLMLIADFEPIKAGHARNYCGFSPTDIFRWVLCTTAIFAAICLWLFPFHNHVSAAATAICGGLRNFTWMDGEQSSPQIILTSTSDWVADCDKHKYFEKAYTIDGLNQTNPFPPTRWSTITIGSSRHFGTNCVDYIGADCAPNAGNKGWRLNEDWVNARDTFHITTTATQVCVFRTDRPGYQWAMNLQIACASTNASGDLGKPLDMRAARLRAVLSNAFNACPEGQLLNPNDQCTPAPLALIEQAKNKHQIPECFRFDPRAGAAQCDYNKAFNPEAEYCTWSWGALKCGDDPRSPPTNLFWGWACYWYLADGFPMRDQSCLTWETTFGTKNPILNCPRQQG